MIAYDVFYDATIGCDYAFSQTIYLPSSTNVLISFSQSISFPKKKKKKKKKKEKRRKKVQKGVSHKS